MVYLGAGTRSSPIAIDDDSEDEVVYQLSSTSSRPQETQYSTRDTPDISTPQPQPHHESEPYRRSSSARSWPGDATWSPSDRRNDEPNFDSGGKGTSYPTAEMFILDPYAEGKRSMAEFGTAIGECTSTPLDWLGPPSTDLDGYTTTKKRKRVGSFTSQDMSIPGPSHAQPKSHPSLANRLSQPESKKARKRRRRAERQAIEEARLQNSAWAESLNSGYSVSDGWSVGDPNDPPPFEVMDVAQPSDVYFTQETPPSPNGSWVSSMAMAAENSIDMKDPDDTPTRWSPLPTQTSLPPAQPPPPLPPPPPASKHTLPPKPPPPQPIPSIGMQPDQDPNSKHGIFHIEKSNKEAGTDMKKRNQNSTYIPNPARTLVMEQLPKTHRNVEFIYKWSRSACAALPVHLFIDPPSAKALVEFATAELARKAWSSPKLGIANLGLKPHQLKGKPREDQIKVWWYRVDGVGAGAGVGEIEEGEIEGDWNVGDIKELMEQPSPQKETKKEKKARLAREREEKKKTKEKKLALQQQQQRQQLREQPPPIQPSIPAQESLQSSQMQNYLTPSVPFFAPVPSTTSNHTLLPTPLNALAQPFQPIPGSYFPGMLASAYSSSTMPLWDQHPSIPASTSQDRPQANMQSIRATNRLLNKTAFGASLNKDAHSDNESIASSAAASTSPALSVKEKETAVEAQQRPRGRPRTIVATKSLADVEHEEEEHGMDVDDDPILNMPSILTAGLVQQLAPPSKQPVGLSSLPRKPVLAPPAIIAASTSRPQKPHSQPQPSSSSFVPRNKNIPPSSPRYLYRDVPPHKLKPQPQSQPQQKRLNSYPQQQPQSRPPTAPRSAHVQQQILQSASTGPAALATITTTTTSSSSSASGSARNTPIPSEPKAMRVQVPASSLAPPVTSTSIAAASSTSQAVRPNMTKEALLARQKDLEERIAKSKEELAAATTAKMKNDTSRTIISVAVGNDNGSSQYSSQASPAPAPVKPAMDLGEKQAMEDRLRKKVLESQKARAVGKVTQSNMQTLAAAELASDSPMLDPAALTPTASVPRTTSTTPTPLSDESTSATPDTQDEKPRPNAPATASSTVSVSSMSSHSFSLEDLAVSFITQTIETFKSQPGTPAVSVSVPMSLEGHVPSSTQPPVLPRLQRQSSNQIKDVKLELAAKQRRLEQHIAETKALMAKLTQARTKEEKDWIMKTLKEKSRLFEEEDKAAALSDDAASASPALPPPKKAEFNFNSVSSSVVGSRTSQLSMTAKATTMTHQFQITRWPVSRHDAGVLILSDDEDEDDGDDEDGAV